MQHGFHFYNQEFTLASIFSGYAPPFLITDKVEVACGLSHLEIINHCMTKTT